MSYDQAIEKELAFKEFQTEVMLIAPKELTKMLQNKYATKTAPGQPGSPSSINQL